MSTIQVHCPDGPGGKEVRASYRLAAKTSMGKVVQKVGWGIGQLILDYNAQ